MSTTTFNQYNEVDMTAEEVLAIIENEGKVTINMENGFNENSDTADVFRGLMGDQTFEESEEMDNAIHCDAQYKHTFILSNATEETPFNEKGMIKRIIKDKYWTNIILHDKPTKQGMYAMINKK